GVGGAGTNYSVLVDGETVTVRRLAGAKGGNGFGSDLSPTAAWSGQGARSIMGGGGRRRQGAGQGYGGSILGRTQPGSGGSGGVFNDNEGGPGHRGVVVLRY